MNINDAFPSSHLKASDLQCRAHTMTMAEVHMERFDEGEKPVLSFSGTHRTLVLNRTNARSISDLHGPETSDWRGRQITLIPEQTDLKGKRVDCIRVDTNPPSDSRSPGTLEISQDDDPEIPF